MIWDQGIHISFSIYEESEGSLIIELIQYLLGGRKLVVPGYTEIDIEIGAKYQVAKDPMAGQNQNQNSLLVKRQTDSRKDYIPVRPVFDRLRGFLPFSIWYHV